MEKKRSNLLIPGLVIGLIIGLWFGINIGKGKPFYSNPFSKKKIERAIIRSGETVIEKSGDALEKTGKALKEKVDKK
ncbi:MAG: hypothetical protein JSV21_01905 [Nitrospirota bacterium]|nr:MAG: hypothetical protein JSV21_01905 [Nitrospirota bacterium]